MRRKTPKKPQVSKYSLFSLRTREFAPNSNNTKMIPLSRYLKERYISRQQFEKFVQKKWVLITRVKGRRWVSELCSPQINDWLGIAQGY